MDPASGVFELSTTDKTEFPPGTYHVDIEGSVSSHPTQSVTHTFIYTFIGEQETFANQQPVFLDPIESQYTITKTPEGNVEPIELGEIFDQENEAVFQDFRCLTCVGNDTAIMLYDEDLNEISFTQDAIAGNF